MTDWSPTSPFDERQPLHRSSDRKVAGIASGIAEQFSVNANLVRLLFAIFTLAGGAGFLLYLGLWILIPAPHPAARDGSERAGRSTILGGGLIGMSVLLGLLTIGGFDPLRFIMLSLLFAGVVLLNRRSQSLAPAPVAMPPAQMPPAPMPFPPPTDTIAPPAIDDLFVASAMPPAGANPTTEYETVQSELAADEPDVEASDTTGLTTARDESSPADTTVDDTAEDETATLEITAAETTQFETVGDKAAQLETEQLESMELEVTDLETGEPTATDVDDSDTQTTELDLAAATDDAPAGRDDAAADDTGDANADDSVGRDWPEPTAQMPLADNRFDPVPLGVVPPVLSPPPLSPPPPPEPPAEPPPLRPFQDHEVNQAAPRSHWAVTKTAEETSLTAGRETTPATPIASITLAAILAVLGVALVLNTLADIFVGAVTVSGISLAFVGLAIAGTSYRGTTLPLIPIAFTALVALVAAPTIDHALQDGTGSKNLVISSPDDLEPRYVLGVGELTLDLRGLELTEDTTIDIEVGTGALDVFVPRDMVVELSAKTNVGYTSAFGESRGGFNPNLRLRPPPSVDPDAPRLFLNTKTVIGGIDVYRR